MERKLRTDTAVAAIVLGVGLLFVLVGKSLLDQWKSAEIQGQYFSFEHLLGLAASSAGAVIIAWWVLSLGLAIVAALLDRAGLSKGAASVSKFSPAFMLRLTVAVMGFGFLTTGAAQASVALPDPSWRPTMALALETRQTAWEPTSLDQPTSTNTLPTDGAGTASARDLNPGWRPSPPVVAPGFLSRQAQRQTLSVNEAVVVKPGDSLWTIAAARLGPTATDVDVALAWPKWYAANRTTIGGDPMVLQPGQVLQPPSSS